MKVYQVNDFHKMVDMQEVWNCILHKSNLNLPFLTMEWQSSWWKTFGIDKKLLVLIAQEQTKSIPCGIAPFMIRNLVGFKIIELLGAGSSDYLDLIISEKRAETIRSFFLFLKKISDSWDILYLKDICSRSDNIPNIIEEANKIGWLVLKKTGPVYPFLRTDTDWNNFLASKSKNFKDTLRKYDNRLKKEELGLRIECQKELEPNSRIIDDLARIEKRSWKFGTPAARLQLEKARTFYSSFLEQFAKKGWLNLWFAYAGSTAAAYLINFDYGNKIWFYNSAFDKEFGRLALGSILHYTAIKDAFLRKKEEYDFLKGSEAYKNRWSSGYRKSSHLIILKKTFRSLTGYMTVLWIEKIARKLKKLRLSNRFALCINFLIL